ncbi:MAG: histidinol dehydrogenase [Clostridia bacterium]|nr:MAG: histidinol dehydrogenase [Clostridia bacterium]
MLRVIRAGSAAWAEFMAARAGEQQQLEQEVKEVLGSVAVRGDAALREYTRRWDGVDMPPDKIEVCREEIEAAYREVAPSFKQALLACRDNIQAFHQRSRPNSWFATGTAGEIAGQVYLPLARVGIYIPGGRAAYPSSVLMTALPAMVAGVEEIIMVTPPGPDGRVDPHVLAAAALAGVNKVYRVGGAQAIAALAFGTATIPKVDKIVGPGNAYVATAKRLVYGRVDIDMVAGPSEVVVVADGGVRPEWVAADLLAQAEHDPLARAVLLTPAVELAYQVGREVEAQLATLPKAGIAGEALAKNGAAVTTRDLEEALALANELAPEHLELMLAEPWAWLARVRNAGAVFLGGYTPEPVGDYHAGPSHVLPTGGTARFFSPLGVEDFLKRTSLIAYTPEGLARAAPSIVTMARVEGLEAHARAVEIRGV